MRGEKREGAGKGWEGRGGMNGGETRSVGKLHNAKRMQTKLEEKRKFRRMSFGLELTRALTHREYSSILSMTSFPLLHIQS